MIGLNALQGINGDLDNLFRSFGGHFLNIHPAGFTGHNHYLGGLPIRNNAQVKLLGDVQALLHQNFFYRPALGTGLMGHQVHADNLSGDAFNLLLGLGKLYPPAFTATAGVDLGFYHDRIATQRFGNGYGFVGGKGHTSPGDGYFILLE